MEGVYEVGMTDKQFSAHLREQIGNWERVEEIIGEAETEKEVRAMEEIQKNINRLREDLAS